MISEQRDVKFHAIESGKFRRYFSLKNLSDPFKVLKGISQSKKLMKSLQPDVVFSKGGFVSVPVVIAAKGKTTVICHESDYTPGLANRIAGRFADTICVTFEDTLEHLGKKRSAAVHTGTPIRRELFSGKRERGLQFLGFDGKKPIILIMGGSLGAAALNDGVRAALPKLTKQFDIVHLCGKGKLDESINCPGYRQYEYIGRELPDLLAATELVVPLPLGASRGDQILNAEYVRKKGYAAVLPQEELTPEVLVDRVNELYASRETYRANMKADPTLDGTQEVMTVIMNAINNKNTH